MLSENPRTSGKQKANKHPKHTTQTTSNYDTHTRTDTHVHTDTRTHTHTHTCPLATKNVQCMFPSNVYSCLFVIIFFASEKPIRTPCVKSCLFVSIRAYSCLFVFNFYFIFICIWFVFISCRFRVHPCLFVSISHWWCKSLHGVTRKNGLRWNA